MMKTSILLLLAITISLTAQEQQSETPEPLELPNFIITGVEQLNVQSGIKQIPRVKTTLTPNLLDSLNSMEKQQFQYLQPVDLKYEAINQNYKRGFLRGDFGSFATLDLEGGYGFNKGGYELYGTGGFTNSNGWEADAEYTKADLKLSSDYIAPEKYYIFGGSRTRTMLDFDYNSFNLYGVNDISEQNISQAWARESAKLGLSVDVEGSFEGFTYNTGAGYNTLQLMSNNTNAFDNQLFAYIGAQNLWRNYKVKGNLSLDFHDVRGSGMQFIQLDGAAEYLNDKISLNAMAGLQIANNYMDNNRGGLLLGGEFEYRISKDLTFNTKARTGLNNNTMVDQFRINPYINYSAVIDFPYERINLQTAINYHPLESFSFMASGALKNYSRYPIFEGDTSGLGHFDLLYEDATIFTIRAETFWNISDINFITALVEYNSSVMEFEDNELPYLPALKASFDYNQKFYDKFGIEIGFDYIGMRYADRLNDRELDAYLDLTTNLDYSVNNKFNIYILLGNLLNTDIVVWENFRENGIYGRVGVLWQF